MTLHKKARQQVPWNSYFKERHFCDILKASLDKVAFNSFNPVALRKAKIVYNFGLSECNRVKMGSVFLRNEFAPRDQILSLESVPIEKEAKKRKWKCTHSPENA